HGTSLPSQGTAPEFEHKRTAKWSLTWAFAYRSAGDITGGGQDRGPWRRPVRGPFRRLAIRRAGASSSGTNCRRRARTRGRGCRGRRVRPGPWGGLRAVARPAGAWVVRPAQEPGASAAAGSGWRNCRSSPDSRPMLAVRRVEGMSHATKPAHPVVAGAPVARRSPLRWIPGWLRPGRSGLAGHRPRPAGPAGLVALREGSRVLIRPVHSTDAALVADGFARLSPRSRQLRFLTAKKQLSGAELRSLTDVDHHDHEALVAVNPADGRGVGIARYIRHAGDPHAAEIAVTIVDDWQGRGLGTELVTRLSGRARHAGICRFTALVA